MGVCRLLTILANVILNVHVIVNFWHSQMCSMIIDHAKGNLNQNVFGFVLLSIFCTFYHWRVL